MCENKGLGAGEIAQLRAHDALTEDLSLILSAPVRQLTTTLKSSSRWFQLLWSPVHRYMHTHRHILKIKQSAVQFTKQMLSELLTPLF